MCEGLLMKANKKLTIICIIITVICIIISSTYLINEYKYDQEVKLRYEAELRRREEVLQRKELQKEADQNARLQYESMLQAIKENSDYYVSFSKKCFSEFQEYGYDEFYEANGSFNLGIIKNNLENEYKSDLLGRIDDSYIIKEEGIIYVSLAAPRRIKGVT
jgi:hypothetical protein